MSWESLNRKVWRMWKADYTLARMAREVSKLTSWSEYLSLCRWSEYLSLCHVVDFLHSDKGIGFSRRQLRYAFGKLPREDVEGSRKEAWAWLLKLGGYDSQVLRAVGKGAYLSREGGKNQRRETGEGEGISLIPVRKKKP